MKLSQLNPGEHAVVTEILPASLTGRLRDLGLTDGTGIRCQFVSPMGDPAAYLFRGSVIALRKRDAERIWVDYAP